MLLRGVLACSGVTFPSVSPFRKPPRWTPKQVAACVTPEGAAAFVVEVAQLKQRPTRPPLPPPGHHVRKKCLHAPLHAVPWMFDFTCFCGATCRELLEALGIAPIHFDNEAVENIKTTALRVGRTEIDASAIEKLAHEAQWRAGREAPSAYGLARALKDIEAIGDVSSLAVEFDALSSEERRAIKISLKPLLHALVYRLAREGQPKKGRRRTVRTHLGCLLEEFLREAGLAEGVAADLFAAGIEAATGAEVHDPLREMRLSRRGKRHLVLVGTFTEADRDLSNILPRLRRRAGPAIERFLGSPGHERRPLSAELQGLRAAIAAAEESFPEEK